MERVNRILRHPLWKGALAQIEELEQERVFCRHDIDHFLHVARLAYIENLEQNLNISKELIYGAALLHDIGKGLQYTGDIPHQEASCAMAQGILDECGFGGYEKEDMLEAIRCHRDSSVAGEMTLRGLIYRADKLSRACFSCSAESACSWSREKKNMGVKV